MKRHGMCVREGTDARTDLGDEGDGGPAAHVVAEPAAGHLAERRPGLLDLGVDLVEGGPEGVAAQGGGAGAGDEEVGGVRGHELPADLGDLFDTCVCKGWMGGGGCK